jgi:histidinol dehydrogenase
MQVHRFPPLFTWENLLKRPSMELSDLEPRVRDIMEDVRLNGDNAVLSYNKKFDGVESSSFIVNEIEIDQAGDFLDPLLKDAIDLAKKNIEKFHLSQVTGAEHVITMPGVECWRKSVPIQKVGLYIPGGTAPLFSTILMLGIPAAIAGCNEVVLCTPPSKDGSLHPAILYAAQQVGIRNIFKVGGVQAIAAMTYGTKTIPQVYKIFGPGNQYVTCAKQFAQRSGVAIDMPAGPSEVAVFADTTANPAFIAADLLSQAEHGIDSQVLLVTTSESIISRVESELIEQVANLPRMEFAVKALENSKIILVNNTDEAMQLLNEYAPEHLILSCASPELLAEQVINAGSVFIGDYSPESVGDYASGTNHTLPTNGFAKSYSGVSVDSFVKKITFQKLTKTGLENIGDAVELLAEAEGLHAHRNAVRIRRNPK